MTIVTRESEKECVRGGEKRRDRVQGRERDSCQTRAVIVVRGREGELPRLGNSRNVEEIKRLDVYLPLQRFVESAMLVFKNPGKLTGGENAWADVLIKGGVLLKHPRRPLLRI